MTARVSVALCTYNGERFIEQQLRSILDQVPAPYEIVVSDDGSTDGTLEIVRAVLREWAGATKTTLLVNETPRGVTGNFEQAMLACGGDVIALSDQDDVWVPGRLARILPAFDDESVLLVASNAQLISAQGHPLDHTLFDALELSSATIARLNSPSAYTALLPRNLLTGATMVVRRSLVEASAPFPAVWVHDEWLAITAALRGRLLVLPDSLVLYRQHGGNQIGAVRLTVRQKLGRLLEPRGQRYDYLAARSQTLLERAPALVANAAHSAEKLAALENKSEHQRIRQALPAARIRRVGPVVREWRTGRYGRFSRGAADIARDLLQPR